MRLRAVELNVTDLSRGAEFLERVWGLFDAGSRGKTRYFRATADHPYVLSLTGAQAPSVEAITFAGSAEEIEHLRNKNGNSKVDFDSPGGGSGVIVDGPEGQRYRFVTDAKTEAKPVDANRPSQLSHVVLNTRDWEACERFAVEKLGFRVSDRTRMMRFLRCNRTHHAVAYVNSDISSLNHIAFEMRDLDAVMNGIGRLREAGYGCTWGPGRHGPGHNVFGYFVAPFGPVVEYTAEVEEVGDDYRVGSPEDWKWPPGRTDHWGISTRDNARMHAAERSVLWS
ncbi:MAG TPA: VOC family protein [Burkholderiales bacterium]|jgi:catechol 2,3-dioxygenase-like lactoylglutathione lyase family enzyme